MSSYPDPALRGDVYPSEEEMDPTGVGPDPATDRPIGAYPGPGRATGTYAVPSPGPTPRPTPAPAPRPPVESHSIVTHHLDGSTEVVTDLDGDGIADVVQFDLDGDGVPDITYLDCDRDGRLDTVVRDEHPTR
ncbi:hypothetical protein [Micromonospora sp. ATCC 39149]|uniref:Uncharacterized protein n=1 Tax=Micromonospora carbonacea TaxID=47853 RepID=A0A7D6CFK6_9ACTN|nr:hypothetical protein [Micromonospora sp. ATCC 39149]QLJ97431.1 hypothetical protein HZU44_21785 [Micromonospora carbonacea]